jgi:hypothetical protein
MRYSLASAAGKGRINEDVVAVFEGDGCTDLVLLDGATPLTDDRCLALGASDPAWFVRRFVRELGRVLRPDADQQTLVLEALDGTRAAYRAAGGSADVPPHAWPIATLAWVRVRDPDAAGIHALEWFCLGDSKVLLQLPDGAVRDLDPFDNPQERATQAHVAGLVAEGIHDPAERWARLLPMLRARRHEQNTAARAVRRARRARLGAAGRAAAGRERRLVSARRHVRPAHGCEPAGRLPHTRPGRAARRAARIRGRQGGGRARGQDGRRRLGHCLALHLTLHLTPTRRRG